ncbi:MAG: hypothetical protein V5A68_06570 [Candidatus Thermoplasmatota archaeon]
MNNLTLVYKAIKEIVPIYQISGGYSNQYGYASAGDYAYMVDQSTTSNTAAVTTAINAQTLGNGGDVPHDYTRIFLVIICRPIYPMKH